jgi:hypothetical protein
MTTETFSDTNSNTPAVKISPLINKTTAARESGLSLGFFSKRLKAGDGPSHIIISGRPYFTREDIIAWMNSKRA